MKFGIFTRLNEIDQNQDSEQQKLQEMAIFESLKWSNMTSRKMWNSHWAQCGNCRNSLSHFFRHVKTTKEITKYIVDLTKFFFSVKDIPHCSVRGRIFPSLRFYVRKTKLIENFLDFHTCNTFWFFVDLACYPTG